MPEVAGEPNTGMLGAGDTVAADGARDVEPDEGVTMVVCHTRM
jgi:hypothetical protein